MIIEIDPNKSAYENISYYYELYKKFKKKAETAKKIKDELIKKIEKKKKENEKVEGLIKLGLDKHTKNYYIFNLTKKILVGKDKKGNMKLVRNIMKPNDLYFHADVHGAASVILVNGQNANETEIKQAGILAACYSSAWKRGLLVCDVFYVKPDQVQTSAPAGEYLAKGAFLITGKRNILKDVELKLGLNIEEGFLKIYPCLNEKDHDLVIRPYHEKKELSINRLLKILREKYNVTVDHNELFSILPEGGFKIIKS